ncbi:MAG: Asp-tRNA(Asn)/Glu-tRNA(Gln) amidotransferase subunit GatA [Thermaerobacter sp.]|nr:Asp-tRNA(Asn)/Glu-tRNA(Gln) amidotransferase subunit GatA [Thermaerobacter sp.]
MELTRLTARELGGQLIRGEVSAQEAVQAYLDRIAVVEARVQAFLQRDPEGASSQAVAVDERRAAGEDMGPLAGVPMALKDNLCTRHLPTTCASRILEGFRPPYDATVTARLRAAGTVLLGKTNLDEFAMGSSSENSGFFPTRNPWDLERVPGGSSAGSAAAVAAGEAAFALGSDTGGSVRQPAAFCGVVGMKPTYGRVSRYGLVAFASSLDQVGTLTRDVADCALVLHAICGVDPLDATSAREAVPDFPALLEGGVRGLTLGVPREYLGQGVEPGVRENVLRAIAALEDLGARAEECSLPHTEYALSTYYLIAPAEASSNLARYDGIRYGRPAAHDDLLSLYGNTRREGFGPEVRRRIMLGTYALSAGYYDAYYLKALRVRTLIRQDFLRAFERFDLLVTPTSPTVAFPLGERTRDPLQMYLADVCTVPVSLAGLPAVSVPAGLSGGLPVGLQIIGRPFDEATVLRAAYALEQGASWTRTPPPQEVGA